MKNILITRSKIRSKKLSVYFYKNHNDNIKVFFQKLFLVKKKFLNQSLEHNQESPIIISSANSIHALNRYKFEKNTPIYCISKITAKKINKLGYHNVIHSNTNSGKDLFNLMINKLSPQKIIYFRGEKISFDFDKMLSKKGFNVQSEIVYMIREINKFSKEIIDFSATNKFDQVLIFSQNSLEIFYKNCLKHNLIEYFKSSNIICMSSKIAIKARKIGFTQVNTFKKYPLLKNFYDSR